jgi:serine/threonine protein kinase
MFEAVARAHPEIAGLVDWRPLARGGFSMVWQARQESLDRLVAVKVDHRTLSEDKERRRFLREAGAAGRLSAHPGFVTVHDAGILPDGRPYLVMDLCPGGSLTQWLKPEGRQSEQRVREVGVRIADALASAHARGVLHRDVKPANILIDAYDNPGLADFGLAALPEPGVDLSVTLEGMTPAYAPKEVFYLKPPTEFGDVYSLAATMYALLDGKPPRWPESGTPSLPELLELQGRPIERLAHVDDEFMGVLLGALDDDPEARPPAAQFRDQLLSLSFEAPSKADLRPVAAPATVVPSITDVARDDGSVQLDGDADRPVSRDRAKPRSRRGVAALLLAAGVVVALVGAALFQEGPPTGRAGPLQSIVPVSDTPTPRASSQQTPTSPRPASPTETPPPDGFVDCSKQLGGKSYCVKTSLPECWVSPYSYANLLRVATMQDCDKYHEDQTFAAGVLPVVVNRQSQFEARKEVQRLCTVVTLDKVLDGQKALKDWQILKLPPQVQIQSDNLFRCLVGLGGRTRPLKLKIPAG